MFSVYIIAKNGLNHVMSTENRVNTSIEKHTEDRLHNFGKITDLFRLFEIGSGK